MTIKAVEVGRDLHITVEGVDDVFVIRPLPASAGRQVTETYLQGSVFLADAKEVEAALLIAVDGGQKTDAGWVPLEHRPVQERMDDTLRQTEAEQVAMAAFFWQTVLGIDGVNEYLDAGGGITGMGKAVWALTVRLGISPQGTSPDSVLASLMPEGSIPSTSIRPGGKKPGKQPQDRQPKKPNANTG